MAALKFRQWEAVINTIPRVRVLAGHLAVAVGFKATVARGARPTHQMACKRLSYRISARYRKRLISSPVTTHFPCKRQGAPQTSLPAVCNPSKSASMGNRLEV